MTYRKQIPFAMMIAALLSVGMIFLIVSTNHESFAQLNTETNQNNMLKQSAMHTGRMNSNITVDQLFDMMDMMHNMMMNMMKIMAHGGIMNGSSSNMIGSMSNMDGMK